MFNPTTRRGVLPNPQLISHGLTPLISWSGSKWYLLAAQNPKFSPPTLIEPPLKPMRFNKRVAL